MPRYHPRHFSKSIAILTLSMALTACENTWWGDQSEPTLDADQISQLIPNRVKKSDAWAEDIYNITEQLGITQSKENICTIIAVVDQESNFVADPVVAGLGAKAVKEVEHRLEEKFTDKLGEAIGGKVASYFQEVLKNHPTPENNYLSQMRQVKTERELDELYREMFDYMAQHYHISALTGTAKLFGQNIGEKLNPITTLGSMQVHISYAVEHKRKASSMANLRTDLYTQYGGLYYGIHRLMMYPADYDRPIYRFADYNSGMYSSRNASFQNMLNALIEVELDLDGDLLLYSKDGGVKAAKSQTEQELLKLFTLHNVLITPRQIRSDLKKEKEKKFEETNTYQELLKIYQEETGKEPVYAMMPEVVISGPKLSRDYNTNWFATRVNGRYETCMKKSKRIKI